MSQVKEITVNVDELLSVNKYNVDEENAHIELVDDIDDEEFLKLIEKSEEEILTDFDDTTIGRRKT